MSFDPYEFDRSYQPLEEQYPVGLYFSNTFLWMFLGLMITFGVAIGSWLTGFALMTLSMGGQLVILTLQLLVVIVFTPRIERMSVAGAKFCFLAYSVLTGLTLSVYLYLYELSSLIFVFLATAVYFGVLGLYGRMTHSDLSGFGPVLLGGLILLIVYGVVSLFVPWIGGFDRLMSLLGIAVFLGYVAYDMQMIGASYDYYCGYPDMLEKASIFSALRLYMDFIGLLLHLLRFLGKRKD